MYLSPLFLLACTSLPLVSPPRLLSNSSTPSIPRLPLSTSRCLAFVSASSTRLGSTTTLLQDTASLVFPPFAHRRNSLRPPSTRPCDCRPCCRPCCRLCALLSALSRDHHLRTPFPCRVIARRIRSLGFFRPVLRSPAQSRTPITPSVDSRPSRRSRLPANQQVLSSSVHAVSPTCRRLTATCRRPLRTIPATLYVFFFSALPVL